VTQADVARVIRACRQAGLTVVRVTVRSNGVSVETTSNTNTEFTGEGNVLAQDRPVVL
jgi:hypothetical protein